jgi:hypothetical protein
LARGLVRGYLLRKPWERWGRQAAEKAAQEAVLEVLFPMQGARKLQKAWRGMTPVLTRT